MNSADDEGEVRKLDPTTNRHIEKAKRDGVHIVATAAANAAAVTADTVVPGRSAATLEAEEVAVGGLLMKLSLPSSAWCRELAQLLHSLSGKA